jgi:hypothetical protein
VGVLPGVLSAVVNLGFLLAFPIWSALMILLDVLVIWVIAVHGSELRSAEDARRRLPPSGVMRAPRRRWVQWDPGARR